MSMNDRSLCQSRLGEITKEPQTWSMGKLCYADGEFCDPYRWPVDYCLSERAEPRCRLHFSPTIAIIVTTLNFFKAALMFSVVYIVKDNPFMTIGDAVASFLDERDTATSGIGLLSIYDAKKGYHAVKATWDDPIRRWKDASSKKRRAFTLMLLAAASSIVIALLIRGLATIKRYAMLSTLLSFGLGFGAVDPRTLILSNFFPHNIALLAVIANFPQLLLSFIYFGYNGIFTTMLIGYEWTSYACKKKGLRISRKPSGFQRSTYFLQLPYRFGIPLVILSGTLHWLVSQSIFVVAFDVYDGLGQIAAVDLGDRTKTCGYSPIAMLAVIIFGSLIVAAVIGFGYIPYNRGMPLAASCSLAISAACHPPLVSGDSVLSEQKLQYGVVSTSGDGIGHCAFSSKEVGKLVKGRTYA
ncbi:hypothetical protein HBI47_117900 [Parastagonospora nodorum]|nr:hypothetical protein HBI47_117900 [Parastagonospora nodorum]